MVLAPLALMSLWTVAPEHLSNETSGVEALIEEARRRQRRRRRKVGAAALAIAGMCSYLAIGGRGAGVPSATPAAHAASRDVPYADPAALHGHGDLAFVSRDRLWVIDGAKDRLTAVSSRSQQASGPRFSPDGRWLTYTTRLLGALARPIRRKLAPAGPRKRQRELAPERSARDQPGALAGRAVRARRVVAPTVTASRS